jgi:hypothetical protein
METKELMKGLRELGLAASVFAGTIFCCEKVGISQAFNEYNNIVRSVYYEANNRYPWAVWGHYGNPKDYMSEGFQRYQKIVSDGVLGLLGLIGASALCYELKGKINDFKMGD